MSYQAYKKYKTVGKWWKNEGRGKFPIQAPAAISRMQKEQKLSFHEAFEKLVEEKAIIFVEDRSGFN